MKINKDKLFLKIQNMLGIDATFTVFCFSQRVLLPLSFLSVKRVWLQFWFSQTKCVTGIRFYVSQSGMMPPGLCEK